MKKLGKILLSLPPWSITIAITAIILYLTLVPHPLPEDDIPMFPGADKLVHAIMFGSLTGAIALDRARRAGLATLTTLFLTMTAILGILAGGLIEILQDSMQAGRSCELLDWVADSIGAILAALLSRPLARSLFN